MIGLRKHFNLDPEINTQEWNPPRPNAVGITLVPRLTVGNEINVSEEGQSSGGETL